MYPANPKLGIWVATQRRNYKLHPDGAPSRMPAERIQALDGIGFEWLRLLTWDERFQQLRDFKVQFGHCYVPVRYSANRALGNWVLKQRGYYW